MVVHWAATSAVQMADLTVAQKVDLKAAHLVVRLVAETVVTRVDWKAWRLADC